MPSFRTGAVTAVLEERRGFQRVEVDGEPAYVLTDLVGDVALGDRVVMNTTAVELGLGTGGWHVVHWNLTREALHRPGRGHVMKLRYTSLQADTGSAEERREIPDDLNGAPVVVLALHSQLAAVAMAVAMVKPGLRVVYVMTDAGALPIAFSDLVHALRSAGLIAATVTTGHAFGGDEEAINVRAGLAVARHRLSADVIIAGMGPGSVGTGTTTGYSGLEVGAILDAAADAHGQPIATLRVSDRDPRPRHQGVSHHSATALRTATHVACVVPIPEGEAKPDVGELHDVRPMPTPDVLAELAARGIAVSSMGRAAQDDPRLFAYAAAAGAYAASVVAPPAS